MQQTPQPSSTDLDRQAPCDRDHSFRHRCRGWQHPNQNRHLAESRLRQSRAVRKMTGARHSLLAALLVALFLSFMPAAQAALTPGEAKCVGNDPALAVSACYR